MADAAELKTAAARAAADEIRDGMRVGIGTGSTAEAFVRVLAERVSGGLSIVGVATSERTEALCRACSVPTVPLDECPELDVTVDGADEIGPGLALIKGGGGALLREKIVAAASRRMVVIADGTKQVATLGRFPLPVEVVPFGLGATRRAVAQALARAGCPGEITLRTGPDGAAFLTDGGHLILDAHPGRIPDPEALAAALAALPGVVEHGLFLGLCTGAILAADEAAGARLVTLGTV